MSFAILPVTPDRDVTKTLAVNAVFEILRLNYAIAARCVNKPVKGDTSLSW